MRTRGSLLVLPRVLVAAYACAVIVWHLLLLTPASGWWPVQLVEVFDVWLYLPLILLIPLAVVMGLAGRWQWGALLVVPVAIFVWQYGHFFVPTAHASGGVPLRVMTANLMYENRDAEGVAALITSRHPDVVGLQELGVGMSELGDMVKDQYPYQALYPSRGSRGMGLLSRYPIVDSKPPEMANGECNCQQVTIDVRGQPVTILNVHPNPPAISERREGPVILPTGFSTRQQDRVMIALRHHASTIRTPLLIMGDMNMTDHERPYQILARVYHDSYSEVGQGFGFTFPSRRGDVSWPFPVIRIDYVFHDDSWTAESTRVEALPGSDHDGILAELALRQRLVQQKPGR